MKETDFENRESSSSFARLNQKRRRLDIVDVTMQQLSQAELQLRNAQERAHAVEMQLAILREEFAQATDEVRALRASTSWKVTRPIRALKQISRKKPRGVLAAPISAPVIPQVSDQPEFAVAARYEGETQITVAHDRGIAPTIMRKPAHSLYEDIRIVWLGGEPDTPGYRYRVLYWAEAAHAAGAHVSHHRLDRVDEYLDEIAEADIVVIWRAAWSPEVDRVVSAVRARGAFLIFDIDDLMIEPRVVKEKFIDGIRSQKFSEDMTRRHFEKVIQTMRAADLCTATTHELAAHFRVQQMPAFVFPNGFNLNTLRVSRMAARARRRVKSDGLFRIGYAGGSKTHQKDFAVCVPAIADILRRYPHARLVVFQDKWGTKILDLDEYPELIEHESQIEWRFMVPLPELPDEMARFDVSLAPLEVGNFFCEAKSELKYFEAALVDVPTVASPTDPYRRAIEHGVTGFLANDTEEWIAALSHLIEHPDESKKMARAALNDVLWKFGPDCRVDRVSALIGMALRGRTAARAFAFQLMKDAKPRQQPHVPSSRVVFEHDRLAYSEVTVVVPLFNYEQYVLQALESVAAQTLKDIDLVVVDDCSTDRSLSVVLEWCNDNKDRFNRLVVFKNHANSKLGPTRNVGFDAAETPYVLTLDADNRLLPDCAELCLEAAKETAAAFVYPTITTFGADTRIMGNLPYDPARFIGGNFIDAMALISKGVWAGVGGYENVPHGWEDFEFWCKIAERGLFGVPQGSNTPLAEYRIHGASMLRQHTNVEANLERTRAFLHNAHPWLEIATDRVGRALQETEQEDKEAVAAEDVAKPSRPASSAGKLVVGMKATNVVISCRSCKHVRTAVSNQEVNYGSVVEQTVSSLLHCGLRLAMQLRETDDASGAIRSRSIYCEVQPSDSCDRYKPAY